MVEVGQTDLPGDCGKMHVDSNCSSNNECAILLFLSMSISGTVSGQDIVPEG